MHSRFKNLHFLQKISNDFISIDKRLKLLTDTHRKQGRAIHTAHSTCISKSRTANFFQTSSKSENAVVVQLPVVVWCLSHYQLILSLSRHNVHILLIIVHLKLKLYDSVDFQPLKWTTWKRLVDPHSHHLAWIILSTDAFCLNSDQNFHYKASK